MNNKADKLLVVESNEALREQIVAVLSDAGYELSTDLSEGVKAVRAFAPDAVILRLCVSFLICVEHPDPRDPSHSVSEHPTVLAGLQFRTVIEVGECGEVADNHVAFSAPYDADDIDNGGDGRPIATAYAS
ncbi:MAG: hypothetical protein WB679_15330 [Terracidiphilus sp.]